MPVLTLPFALIGLIALPAVAGIYLFRSRSKRRKVSSLMLWEIQRRSLASGVKRQRFEVPLLLLLELAALALMCLAAANPHVLRPDAREPLIVVLDDSFSMLAGARAAGMKELSLHFTDRKHESFQLITAGTSPRLLVPGAVGAGAARDALKEWTCLSPQADINKAIALAGAIGGPRAKILVVTDSPPAGEISGRIVWLALGQNLPNVAIVNAVRGPGRCLIELANFSSQSRDVALSINNASATTKTVTLEAQSTSRLTLSPADDNAPLVASLADDALAIDNSITLLNPSQTPVRVKLDISQARLLEMAHKACEASGIARIGDLAPDVVVTDSPPGAGADGAGEWVVRILSGAGEGVSYTGPFIVDHRHPLAQGLALDGVIWGAGQADETAGDAGVIWAGDIPLLTERRLASDRREICLRLSLELSNIHQSPNWPILFHNLLSWRRQAGQRLTGVNVRLGQTVGVKARPGQSVVRVVLPDGNAIDAPAPAGVAAINVSQVGLHQVDQAGDGCSFAAGALCADESDLSRLCGGQWGQWADQHALRMHYHSLAALIVLGAAGLVTLHGFLVHRRWGGAIQ